MLEIPRRDSLDALTAAADAVVTTSALGFARARTDGRVSVLYSYPLGLGEWVLTPDLLPDALLPSSDAFAVMDRAAVEARRTRAVEAFLLDTGTHALASMRLPGVDPETRLWMGLRDEGPLSSDRRRRLDELVPRAAALFGESPSHEALLQRLVRLEQAAALIPALAHVLDVREVIDRLSATATRALPHDRLFLNLFSDDLSTATVYARSDKGTGIGMVMPNPYPAATIQAWTFSIVDDHTKHPMERETPSTKLGVRSSLRFPIRFGDRVCGGVAFLSFTPRAFSDADVPVGRRLSELVASAISHFRMAERLAEQARQTQELQSRATNLELLDELLTAVIDTGDLREMLDRISAITAKVLPHAGAALMVHLPGGRRARLYASSGFPAGTMPDVMEIPPELLDPAWEYDIEDDLTTAGPQVAAGVGLGFRSRLRVPIRLEGASAGGLMIASRSPAAFKQADILVARRVADRLAVRLAHDREVAASRRADEASARAARLEARVEALTQELDERTGYRRVIGESASWKQVLTQATQVAATETTALLLGESGTGKEVVARFIHRASKRSRGPFIALNCAALPDQLLEAELFGYERGAFTGATQSKPGQLEQASGGTLFLDEVGEMSLPAQAKFLRVLQEREFQRLGGTRVLRTDARIVAATNRDLQHAIAHHHFREDLFYRLNVFAIRLPPLRDRRDDVLPLTQAFLTEFGRAFAHPPAGISREARDMLLAYHWPGNIRELRNILERAAILCDGGLITGDHLSLPPARTAVPLASPLAPPAPETPAAALRPAAAPGDLPSVERAMIEEALATARFNKSKAARALGLTRHQLYIRMRRHGLVG
ncbi:MAG TPA: sigma 54-interacting transcriptional regulator [Vicinamibacterales bacterium]|nr:sigma 54-interacting transcriptional regulator [Vicinamibacterales bacterium]